MPQSLTQIYLHIIFIIFSTKNRQPFLNNEQIRKQTHAYLAGICKNLQCPSLLVGGVADHVHLLTRHLKNGAVAAFIGNLKRDSSKSSLPRQNTIAVSRFRMNFAGYVRNMALSLMNVTFGIELRERFVKPLQGF